MTAEHEVDAMLDGFLECALWSSTDDAGEPMDAAYDPDDLDLGSLMAARELVASFHEAHREDLAIYHPAPYGDRWEAAGHDLWLTINSHGCGYWDRATHRDPPEIVAAGERLAEAARTIGERWLYVTDAGTVGLT